MSGADRSRTGFVARLAVSVGVLAALAAFLEPDRILSRLGEARPSWVVLALGISVLQVAASAWRWRFTVRRLGIGLPFREALREYYLATFLNQVLPGGVAGDVSRAWRHTRVRGVAGDRKGTAVRGVVLERASGQLVMTAAAGASILALPLPAPAAPVVLAGGVAAGAVLAVAIVVALRRRGGGSVLPRTARRSWREFRTALLGREAITAQLVSSGVVVASCIAMYLTVARAIGVEEPFPVLLPLVAPILVAMLVPFSVAGWGVREGAAAALWATAGLPAAEGVAVSVTYGVLVLVSSLPGGLVLARGLVVRRRSPSGGGARPAPPTPPEPGSVIAGPGRTARRRPGRSAGTVDAGPPGASRSAPASAPGGPTRSAAVRR